jgi:hypothetical protein
MMIDGAMGTMIQVSGTAGLRAEAGGDAVARTTRGRVDSPHSRSMPPPATPTHPQKHKPTEEDYRGERWKDYHRDLKGDNDLLSISRVSSRGRSTRSKQQRSDQGDAQWRAD